MAKWALIADGVVTNVVVTDTQPEPSAVDVTGIRVGVGDLYDGTTFTPRPLTTAEIEAQRAQEIRALVTLALSMLQEIIDTPQPTISNVSQAQAAIRGLQTQVKTEARVLRRIVRLVAGVLDGTD